MSRRLSVLFVLAIASGAFAQAPLGAEFTYQGQLKQSGAPLNNTADFEFKLFNAPSGGAQVGSTEPVSNVNVVDGLFTVSLDFGSSPYNGDQRWLEIAARSPAGGGNFTTLTPRQPLTATPFALYALTGPGSGGPWAVSGNNIFNTNTGNVDIGTASPANRLSVVGGGADITGNVGIGTSSPAAKLDVRGNIRLGTSGQFFAPAGEENLRIVRGTIAANGNILEGDGFTVNHPLLGIYVISFRTSFAAPPTVTATFTLGNFVRTATIYVNGPHTGSFVNIAIDTNDSDHESFNHTDREFNFIAIGPR